MNDLEMHRAFRSPPHILKRALRCTDSAVYIECNQQEVPQRDQDIRQALRKVCY